MHLTVKTASMGSALHKVAFELRGVESQVNQTVQASKASIERYDKFWKIMWVLVAVCVGLVIIAIVLGIIYMEPFWGIILGGCGASSGIVGILLKLLHHAEKVEDKEQRLKEFDNMIYVLNLNLAECEQLSQPRKRMDCRWEQLQHFREVVDSCRKVS